MTHPEVDGDGRGEAPPGMPRWVKVSAFTVFVIAVVLVVIMLVVGGEHGPGLHTGTPDSGGTVTSMVG